MKELIYNILLMYKQLLAPKELQIYNIKFSLTTKQPLRFEVVTLFNINYKLLLFPETPYKAIKNS